MASHRMARVSELIRQQLNKLLIKELEWPKDCLITITRVKTTRDLSYTDVYISIMPLDRQAEVMQLLENRRWKLQSILAKKITIAMFPTIRFRLDDTEERAAHIESLIDSLNDKE
ncbi:MAG: 30S ribosome-binding factor RbfA [Patescibacteria group bacterium]